jgi:hypothetical protein
MVGAEEEETKLDNPTRRFTAIFTWNTNVRLAIDL